jgi:hypothetical protein
VNQFDRRDWLKTAGLTAGAAVGILGTSAWTRAGESAGAANPAASSGPADAEPASTGSAITRVSLNENPFGPAPAVTAALQHEFVNQCRYTAAEYDVLVNLCGAHW